MFHSFDRTITSLADSESSKLSEPPRITALVAYSKGFACTCGTGTVHIYEKTDDKDFFKKAREIKVCMPYS